jgi:two-component system LytT family sensor kinase
VTFLRPEGLFAKLCGLASWREKDLPPATNRFHAKALRTPSFAKNYTDVQARFDPAQNKSLHLSARLWFIDNRMRSQSKAPARWVKGLPIIGGWTLYGLFFTSQAYLNQAFFGKEVRWGQALAIWMLCAFAWALLTPAILWLGRRFPFSRPNWLSPLLVHIAAATFFSFFSLVVYMLVWRLLLWSQLIASLPFSSLKNLVIADFHSGLLIYASIIAIRNALDTYRKYQEREVIAAQLEAQLTQAQLDALRKQLHPHFLFNTLNTVSILIDEDTVAARNMLVRLSDLLRSTLDSAKTHEVSLKQELEFITGYLEIERMRFSDRLSVEMHIDPAALNAQVPDLILQPLVENAIRHGIAPRSAAGTIAIYAERQNGDLRLQVLDNGKGLPPERQQPDKQGVGIANTRSRLQQLYGVRHRFEIANLDEGGVRVAITIPFHTASGVCAVLESGE